MFEYSSVSASSYDPGALVAKLNESTADGWDVVAIVPTGGDVSAFLKREAPAADAEAPGDTGTSESTEGSADEAVGAAAAVGAVDVAPDVSDQDAPPEEGDAGAEAVVDATGETEAPAETPGAVEEPAGWAAAPEETPTDVPLGTSGESAAEPAATVVAAEPAAAATEEPAAEAAAEPTPAPAPAAPEPAPVVTTPAGWYPDPSGRYELRYWDGGTWTEHVSRAGQQYTDAPVA